jgi:selenocysteine lyase/cysteine desulfurase
MSTADFGKDIMVKEFVLDPQAAFINHGSFGTAPRSILQKRIHLIEEQEQQPDQWFRKLCEPMWQENLAIVSRFVGASPQNLVFVANTTTGFNAVLRSLKLNKGDAILLQPYTYFAVRNTCRYIADCKGLELVDVKLPLPLTCIKRLIDAYDQALTEHPNIKIVVLDYISSVPPILMPVKELIQVCHRHGALVFVDGAHTPGQLQLDLDHLGADFYAGNLHKWAFAVRGCAVLWIHPDYHHHVFPVVTSRYDTTDMGTNYSYQGTNDNTQYFSAADAIEFYQNIGGFAKISKYNTELITKAADMLVARWKTGHYPLAEQLKAPYMRMVRLPHLKKFPLPEKKFAVNDMNNLMDELWTRFHIQAVCLEVDSLPWVRLSTMVYNCMEDYQRLADAVSMLQAEEFSSGGGDRIPSKL